MASVEEKVEEYYKAELDSLGIRHYTKTEKINDSIADALKNANSKSGNKGNNYPDIRCLLENKHRRNLPVMMEAKGSKGKLEKLTKDGDIELISNGKKPYYAVMNFAVNGALHYGNAILDEGTYKEVLINIITMLVIFLIYNYTQIKKYVLTKLANSTAQRSLKILKF